MKKTMANAVQLTEADKFFIEAKTKEGVSLEDIAKSVNKPLEVVKEFADKIVVKKEKSLFEKNLHNKTVGGKKAGVTAMTQSASQASDEAKKQNKVGKMKYMDSIAKIRDDD